MLGCKPPQAALLFEKCLHLSVTFPLVMMQLTLRLRFMNIFAMLLSLITVVNTLGPSLFGYLLLVVWLTRAPLGPCYVVMHLGRVTRKKVSVGNGPLLPVLAQVVSWLWH